MHVDDLVPSPPTSNKDGLVAKALAGRRTNIVKAKAGNGSKNNLEGRRKKNEGGL